MPTSSRRGRLLALLVLLPLWAAPAPAVDYIWERMFAQRLQKAQAGDPEAQYAVGEMYLKGRGPAVDPEQALVWFGKAARQGHVKAKYRLGYMHLRGLGTRKDVERAFALIREAAEAGYSPAQFQLGRMYASGTGTTRDLDQALAWLRRAAAQDYVPAREEIPRLEAERARMAQAARAGRARTGQPKRPERRRPAHRAAAGAKTARAERGPEALRAHLLRHAWLENGWPAEHLPSPVTSCTEQGEELVCRSRERERVADGIEMTYFVETRIGGFGADGRFRATYRANITYAMPEDPDDPEANVVIPPTGWQKTVHELDCRLDPEGVRIDCTKDGRTRVRFRRAGPS